MWKYDKLSEPRPSPTFQPLHRSRLALHLVSPVFRTQILRDIPQQRIESMQRALARVWHRFVYASHPHLQTAIRRQQGEIKHQEAAAFAAAQPVEEMPPVDGSLLPQRFTGQLGTDDAFATIMQWLHSRINATR